jgi:hypothetical protein
VVKHFKHSSISSDCTSQNSQSKNDSLSQPGGRMDANRGRGAILLLNQRWQINMPKDFPSQSVMKRMPKYMDISVHVATSYATSIL